MSALPDLQLVSEYGRIEHGYDPEKHWMVTDAVAAEELTANPVEVELAKVPASHPVQAPKGYEQAAAERADFGMNGPGQHTLGRVAIGQLSPGDRRGRRRAVDVPGADGIYRPRRALQHASPMAA